MISDILVLTKPSVVLSVVLLSIISITLSELNFQISEMVCSFIGIILLVSSASVINMYVEQDYDKYMERTMRRPLPSGRLNSQFVFIFGFLVFVPSLPMIYSNGNIIATILSAIAFLIYIFIYTPLKRYSSFALFLGAISGAMPILIGYSLVSKKIDLVGIILFLFIFFWQIPHVISVEIFRNHEYKRAGFCTMIAKYRFRTCFSVICFNILFTILSSQLLWWYGVLTNIYALGSVFFGVWFFLLAFCGIFINNFLVWARRLFYTSLIYQLMVFFCLIFDRFLFNKF